jgi:hypothetical protein
MGSGNLLGDKAEFTKSTIYTIYTIFVDFFVNLRKCIVLTQTFRGLGLVYTYLLYTGVYKLQFLYFVEFVNLVILSCYNFTNGFVDLSIKKS